MSQIRTPSLASSRRGTACRARRDGFERTKRSGRLQFILSREGPGAPLPYSLGGGGFSRHVQTQNKNRLQPLKKASACIRTL